MPLDFPPPNRWNRRLKDCYSGSLVLKGSRRLLLLMSVPLYFLFSTHRIRSSILYGTGEQLFQVAKGRLLRSSNPINALLMLFCRRTNGQFDVDLRIELFCNAPLSASSRSTMVNKCLSVEKKYGFIDSYVITL